jgi:hypothetical protein
VSAKEEQHHDPQIVIGRVSLVLAEEESEDRQTPQLGHVQIAGGCGEARARRAVFQAALKLAGGRPAILVALQLSFLVRGD